MDTVDFDSPGKANSDDVPVVIHCWSGPRCVSTSLMYSFAQRADVIDVCDEPLYAVFLRRHPELARPYRSEVLQAQPEMDGVQRLDSLIQRAVTRKRSENLTTGTGIGSGGLMYMKHMAKHGEGIPQSIFTRQGHKHFLLVRGPEAVTGSFSRVLEASLLETCYPALMELYSQIRIATGDPPVVVLSEDLVERPEATLRALCSSLNIAFDSKMLSWPCGPKPYDGLWAPWWYKTTHTSTGFGSESSSDEKKRLHQLEYSRTLTPSRRLLLDECRPFYEFLRNRALTVEIPEREQLTGGKGTHTYHGDSRNGTVLVGIRNGVGRGTFDLVPRPEAKVSVLDAGFMLGDGVWEGIRLHRGHFLFLEDHLDRLYEGAASLDMVSALPTRTALVGMLQATVDANGMKDGIHIRVMVTRGLKSTGYQHPKCTIGHATVVILPEYKVAEESLGIRLFTVHVRRGNPDSQDPAWNSHSKLNCIAACIQASKAGADEALMLDPRGFVATCNSTNFFIVRNGQVWTSKPGHIMQGITRGNIIKLCSKNGIPCIECDFTLTQVYSAEEAFVTGTFGGLIPVIQVDGRVIGKGVKGDISSRLQRLYAELCDEYASNS